MHHSAAAAAAAAAAAVQLYTAVKMTYAQIHVTIMLEFAK